MRCILVASLLILTQAACSTTERAGGDIKPLPWSVGKFAPDYMEVHVKGIDVVDENGKIYHGVDSGPASVQTAANGSGNPVGWPKTGRGGSNYVRGAALPRSMVVVWYSLVEPQSYMVSFDIPEDIRREMRRPHKVTCHNDTITSYRNHVAVGLAPGGIAVAKIMGLCLEPITVGRFEGVNLRMSDDQKAIYSNKRYLDPATIRYLENNPIPYGSW